MTRGGDDGRILTHGNDILMVMVVDENYFSSRLEDIDSNKANKETYT